MATFSIPSGLTFQFTEVVAHQMSPRLSFGREKTIATRVIDVDWAFYEVVPAAILGSTYVIRDSPDNQNDPNPGNGYRLQRVIPWAFPVHNNASDRAWLWATSVDIEGLGAPSNNTMNNAETGNQHLAAYKTARCTIHYETLDYDILSDSDMRSLYGGYDESNCQRYVTKVFRPQGEFLNIDGAAYKYCGLRGNDGGAVAVSRGINKMLLSVNMTLMWRQIPIEAVPSAFFNRNANNQAIERCLGRVNHDTFLNCRQGTLLLLATELKPYVLMGNRYYDITYFFKWFNPHHAERDGNVPGHNHVFRPIGTPAANQVGWFEAVTSSAVALGNPPTNFAVARNAINTNSTSADGVNIYDFANFRALFRPAGWKVGA